MVMIRRKHIDAAVAAELQSTLGKLRAWVDRMQEEGEEAPAVDVAEITEQIDLLREEHEAAVARIDAAMVSMRSAMETPGDNGLAEAVAALRSEIVEIRHRPPRAFHFTVNRQPDGRIRSVDATEVPA